MIPFRTLGVVCIHSYKSAAKPHPSAVRHNRFKAKGWSPKSESVFSESEHAMVMLVGRGVGYSSSSTDLIQTVINTINNSRAMVAWVQSQKGRWCIVGR